MACGGGLLETKTNNTGNKYYLPALANLIESPKTYWLS